MPVSVAEAPYDATPVTARCQVLDQAPGEVETALVPLWSLMRFLSLRLKQKAAARPRMGRGPGTEAGAVGPLKLLMVVDALPVCESLLFCLKPKTSPVSTEKVTKPD